VIYILRHGEILHHRADGNLTPRGRQQAKAVGLALANEVREGDTLYVLHSPVRRVAETARLLYENLYRCLERDGRLARITLHSPQPDPALHNVRFIVAPGLAPQEPSLLYTEMNTPEYMAQLTRSRAEFYRGFWSSADPMGYWLIHDSEGGAESPTQVFDRLKARLGEILGNEQTSASNRRVYILVTHSGAMRVLLREALGTDPGEPGFCEIIALEPTAAFDCAALKYRHRLAQISLH
jgi:broad specificity phosphatase PhoE